jgi:tetratricopeptide (TPR) repeat protein
MTSTENAVTRRAEIMQRMWRNYLKHPTAQTAYWVMEPDAMQMITVFHELNSRDSEKTPDLFIRFKVPFENITHYGSMLSEFLSDVMEIEKHYFEQEGIPFTWQSEHIEDPSNHALGFLRNFFNFAVSMELGEGVVIAYIAPDAILDEVAWERWCYEATQFPLPAKIRLMFVEQQGNQILQKLAKKYPERICTLKPKLDIPNAVRELLSESGDQTDKGTDFQKAFFELTQSVSQKDVVQMKAHAQKAIEIAQNMGYPHLEIAVLCATANGYIANQQPKIALATYDEALRVAAAGQTKPLMPQFPDLKVDDSNGTVFDQLILQILFSKGSALVAQRMPKYDEALMVYQQADSHLQNIILEKKYHTKEKNDFENGGILYLHRIEALRLMGYCQEGLKQKKQALETYKIAVTIAEKLPIEIRTGSTLSFVGQAMMQLYHGFASKKSFLDIVQQMNFLLGESWDKVPKK